jgi:hypothetical protein
MNPIMFWLSDEQWSKIEPHLPTNKRGPERNSELIRSITSFPYIVNSL